jgi:hypothetical protein
MMETHPDVTIIFIKEKTVPQLRRLVAGFPKRRPGFEPRSRHVGFVVNKVALGQVFSEYFGFLGQFSFHRLLHTHHHPSSGAGTIRQLVADVRSGLSLTPTQETKIKIKNYQGSALLFSGEVYFCLFYLTKC